MKRDGVILIDDGRNTSSNAKTVLNLIHNSNGKRAFIDAWDLTGMVYLRNVRTKRNDEGNGQKSGGGERESTPKNMKHRRRH